MKKFLTIVSILALSCLATSSCHDDDEDTVRVLVSIRVDLNVPEYATVFNQKVKLTNDDTWLVTLENFRTHQFVVNKPKNGIPDIPSPTRTDNPKLQGIFSVIPSKYNPDKDVFKLQSQVTKDYIIFILTP